MTIEFLGAPCSGKSKISHELMTLLRENGINACEPQYVLTHLSNRYMRMFYKGYNILKRLFFHPIQSYRILKNIKNIIIWFNYLNILGTRKKDKIIIFEQGLCQCIGAIYDNRKPDKVQINDIFNKILPEKNDRIQVYIKTEKNTIINRMNLREDKPFYKSENDGCIAINNSILTAEMLSEIWKKKYGDNSLIVVSNNEDGKSKEKAKKIMEKLEENNYL